MLPMVVTLDVSKLSGWLNTPWLNMDCMFVTLEVSKLSGWLNAYACCRVETRHTMRGEVWPGRREAAGARGARSVQGRARLQTGGREERT